MRVGDIKKGWRKEEWRDNGDKMGYSGEGKGDRYRNRRDYNRDNKSRKKKMENSRSVCKRGYKEEATESERVNGGERGGEFDNNRWGP